MAHSTQTADIKSRIKAQLGDTWPHMALARLPQTGASAEEISKAGLFDGIQGREAYLAWVTDYKALIRDVEAEIRTLKAERRNPDIWAQASAQSSACWLATAATALIRARRLGKTWSADQAKRRLNDAA